MIKKLHKWNITPKEGIELQKHLRSLIIRKWDGRRINFIGGLDVHFPAKNTARAVAVVMTFPELKPIETSVKESRVDFPYVPGLLSFREIPALLMVIDGLKIKPDVFLCDGQGIAHPRGVGLASHLGLVIDSPTIGCAKSPLYGSFTEPAKLKGSKSSIKDEKGNTIGCVLRTRSGVKPIYVSIGHLINLRTAVKIVLECSPKYRIPEPLRLAHRLAGEKKGE